MAPGQRRSARPGGQGFGLRLAIWRWTASQTASACWNLRYGTAGCSWSRLQPAVPWTGPIGSGVARAASLPSCGVQISSWISMDWSREAVEQMTEQERELWLEQRLRVARELRAKGRRPLWEEPASVPDRTGLSESDDRFLNVD